MPDDAPQYSDDIFPSVCIQWRDFLSYTGEYLLMRDIWIFFSTSIWKLIASRHQYKYE